MKFWLILNSFKPRKLIVCAVAVTAIGCITNHNSALATLNNDPVTIESEKIAFIAQDKEGKTSLYLMGADGSDPILLTGEGDNWSPVLFAGGKQIIFLSDREVLTKKPPVSNDPFYHPEGHLYLMDVGHTEVKQLTFGASKTWLPSASPDGKKIAFLSNRDAKGDRDGDLYVMNLSDLSVTRITENKNWPLEKAVWLSNHELMYNIFIDHTLELFTTDLDTLVQKQITHSVNRTKNGYLALSFDRKKIATTSRDREKDDREGIVNPQIYTIAKDGSGRTRVTHNAFIDYFPSWSPDGESIAFLRENSSGADGKPSSKLILIKQDGSKERQLGQDIASFPCWLQGKNTIVFAVMKDDFRQIHFLNVDTGALKIVKNDKMHYQEPSCAATP